jgi:hypothetical protein
VTGNSLAGQSLPFRSGVTDTPETQAAAPNGGYTRGKVQGRSRSVRRCVGRRLLGTMGGLLSDDHGRVLRQNGTVIGGLRRGTRE